MYKVTSKRAYVSDTDKGIVNYPINEFENKWYDPENRKGAALVSEPQADFNQREADQKIERKTINSYHPSRMTWNRYYQFLKANHKKHKEILSIVWRKLIMPISLKLD